MMCSWFLVSGRSPIADNQERNQRAQAQQEKSVGEGRSVEGIEGVEGSSSALPAGCEKGAEDRRSTTAPKEEEHLVDTQAHPDLLSGERATGHEEVPGADSSEA